MLKAIYIAGPMRGIPEFNFPAFHRAAEVWDKAGWVVFNPAARDNEVHGTDISAGNTTGSIEQAAEEHGFNLRDALGADCAWICSTATAIYMLDGWSKSAGATAERALALALGLDVYGAPA